MPDREPSAGDDQSPVGGAATTGPRETPSTERPVSGPISESAALPKYCPQCGNEYDPGLSFCPKDGNVLQVRHGEHSLVGQILGRHYRILELLGEGGMGQVFLAEHVRIGRRCAIKVMRPALVRDPGAVGRFGREAMTAGRINHRNAVAVYDFGETDDGLIYIVMEHVEGESLSHRLAREGALPPAVAAQIALQICDALVAAHRLGIIHRDLKPDNILVGHDEDGRELVKVVDFGIAKAVNDNNQTTLTKTGFVLGTLQYMSPEQLIGEQLDGRSDIYSLGCILFEMLTGERTFAGPSGPAVVVRRLTEAAPTARSRKPDIPEVLDTLVSKSLARAVADRFQTAEELKGALQAYLGASAGTASVPLNLTTATAAPPAPAAPVTAQPAPPTPVSAPPPALGTPPAGERAAPSLESAVAPAPAEPIDVGSPPEETIVVPPPVSPSGAQPAAASIPAAEPPRRAPPAAPVLETAPPPRRSRRRIALAASLAVLAAGAFAVARAVRQPSTTVAAGGTPAAGTSAPVHEPPAPPQAPTSVGTTPSTTAAPHEATSSGNAAGPAPSVSSPGRAEPAPAKHAGPKSGEPVAAEHLAATATVRVLGTLPAGAVVLLDGHLTRGTVITTTPGAHTIAVVATGFEPARWQGRLQAGSTYPWSVTLRPLPTAVPTPVGTPLGPATNATTAAAAPAPSPPPVTSPAAPAAAPAQPSAESEEAVRAAVSAAARRASDDLARAISSRDVGALRRAWPGIPPVPERRWREFLLSPDNLDIAAHVAALRPPEVEGASASVPFSVSVEFNNRASGRGTAVSRFTATFARQGGDWTLTGIRPGW